MCGRIEKRIADLETAPEVGVADGALRQLVIAHRYIAIYRVRRDEVEIVTIVHSSRKRRS